MKRTHNNLCDSILQKKSVEDNLPSVRWVSIGAVFSFKPLFWGKEVGVALKGPKKITFHQTTTGHCWSYRELSPEALGCETHRFWCWTLVKDRTFAGAKLVGSPWSVATRDQICQLVLMRDVRIAFKIFQGEYLRMKGLRWKLHQFLGCSQDFYLAIQFSGEGG